MNDEPQRTRPPRARSASHSPRENEPVPWRITPYKHTDPARVERALLERVKELNCLYAMAQLNERYPDSLVDWLKGVVDVLPPSWQYPEITCARITFDGRIYRSRAFKVTPWKQTAEIALHGAPAGEVAVFYTEQRPPCDEGPFLKEERALLDSVAERIGAIAMRVAAEHALQEANRQLTVEREALRESNAALRAVLARIEDEKREIRMDIQANVDKILLPILHALAIEVSRPQRKYIEILRDNLEDLVSPFVNRLAQKYRALSPTEIQICNMIRSGLHSKEIARLRGVSPATVSRHREHIRHKLGIANQAVNLTTCLQTLS